MPINISTAFDSGAVEILEARIPDAIRLAFRKDSTSDPTCQFRQWFHFRLQGARGKQARITLVNVGETTYAGGWKDYRAVASYDREDWFRVDTRLTREGLIIEHAVERDSIYFAYFEPYSWERHLAFLGWAGEHPIVRIERLGATVDGRDLDALVIGNPRATRKVWVIARQHPGETMAEWCAQGLVERLLDGADPTAQAALELAQFYVVPNMNPDGSIRGNLRANAAGANLNREWQAPSVARSPEVFHVKKRMLKTGCDLFLDLHGDENLPYIFTDGNGMLPGFTRSDVEAEQAFVDALLAASPDYQTAKGYRREKFKEEFATLASKWAWLTFGCVALTLEMPFKDNLLREDPRHGWDGARSRRLGAALLQPALLHLRSLKTRAARTRSGEAS
jgi:murein tripeptide amidase MpaA